MPKGAGYIFPPTIRSLVAARIVEFAILYQRTEETEEEDEVNVDFGKLPLLRIANVEVVIVPLLQ